MQTKIPLLALLFFISYNPIQAQLLRGPTASVGMQLAIPRGEYASFYKGMPYGVNASISIPFLGLPIEGGGGFSWNQVGSKGRKVVLSDALGNIEKAELRVNGNAYTYYVSARLRPFNGKFRPYGEFLAGMRSYSVKSKLYELTEGGRNIDPLIDVSDRDFAWVTGWAVGIQYRLLAVLFLEARFEKLRGDRTQYINPQTISITPAGEFSYEKEQSRTDQLTFSLGLAFSF